MRSDALFYELFQVAPWTFFELLQITPPCSYRFESITVKSAEKRIDGVLEPEQKGKTIYFVEVQAYAEKVIYWRTMREVATYFEQRPFLNYPDWQAIVLFLDMADDPGFGSLAPLADIPIPRLLAVNLLQVLSQLQEHSLVLNVLRPLIARNETEVRKHVTMWADHIRHTPDLTAETRQRLVTVLAQLVMQKFARLTYKELSRMLRLIPLEETIDGKELIQNQNLKLITRQIKSRFFPTPEIMEVITADLSQLSLESLELLFEDIFDIDNLTELETWINNHRL